MFVVFRYNLPRERSRLQAAIGAASKAAKLSRLTSAGDGRQVQMHVLQGHAFGDGVVAPLQVSDIDGNDEVSIHPSMMRNKLGCGRQPIFGRVGVTTHTHHSKAWNGAMWVRMPVKLMLCGDASVDRGATYEVVDRAQRTLTNKGMLLSTITLNIPLHTVRCGSTTREVHVRSDYFGPDLRKKINHSRRVQCAPVHKF